jgi:glycosyltransferase involved in cell wall biosynthesis
MVVGLAPPYHSGAGKQAADLAQEIVRRGRAVELLTTAPGARRPRREKLGNVSVWRVPVSIAGSRRDKALFSLALAMRLLSRPRRYRVVHLHGSYYLLRTLTQLKSLLGLRIVYKATMCGKDDAATIARHRGRGLIDAVDRWVCIAEPIAAATASAGVGERAIERLRNAIDVRRFHPGRVEDRAQLRERLGLPDSAAVWASVGTLSPRKRFHLLVEAWAELPPPRPTLLLVGPDADDRARAAPEYACRVERLIADLGLDGSVRLLGAQSDVGALLRGLDGFLFASEHEGLPNAVLEALACGLPVLSTRFEAADDVFALADGRARFVAADPAAFAAAVADMPAPGVVPDAIRALDVERIVDRYLDLYADLGREAGHQRPR